jgi:hypothetical protein
MITPADSAPQAPGQMPASAWDIQAPYAAGPEVHIQVHGDSDAGGQDKTSPTVAGAVAAAMARQHELESDTFGQGSVIGDLMAMPPNQLDPGVGATGTTDPAGAFYDPPRNYGG